MYINSNGDILFYLNKKQAIKNLLFRMIKISPIIALSSFLSTGFDVYFKQFSHSTHWVHSFTNWLIYYLLALALFGCFSILRIMYLQQPSITLDGNGMTLNLPFLKVQFSWQDIRGTYIRRNLGDNYLIISLQNPVSQKYYLSLRIAQLRDWFSSKLFQNKRPSNVANITRIVIPEVFLSSNVDDFLRLMKKYSGSSRS